MEKSNLPFKQLPGLSAGGQGGEEEGEGGPAQQLSRHDDVLSLARVTQTGHKLSENLEEKN